MAVNYASYVNQVRDPVSSVMQGVQIGSGITQIQTQRANNELKNKAFEAQKAIDDAYDIDAGELGKKIDSGEDVSEDFVTLGIKYPKYGKIISQGYKDWATQREAKKIQEKQAAFNTGLLGLADKVKDKKATANDIIEFSAKNPEQTEHIQKITELWSDAKKEEVKKDSVMMLTALESGDTDFVISMMDKKIAALGDDQKAEKKGYESMKRTLENGDTVKVGQTTTALLLNSLMDDKEFAGTWDKIQSRSGEIRKRPLDLKKMEIDLAAMESGEIPKDPEKMFKAENDLRDEYSAISKDFREMSRMNSNIQQAGGDGAGDLALITSFMKLLDPGSVVRETEFANALKTSGLLESLRAKKEQILEGDMLSPATREKFKTQAKKLISEASKQDKDIRSRYEKIVKNYGLNKENIFVTEEIKDESEEEKPPPASDLGPQSIIQNINSKY